MTQQDIYTIDQPSILMFYISNRDWYFHPLQARYEMFRIFLELKGDSEYSLTW